MRYACCSPSPQSGGVSRELMQDAARPGSAESGAAPPAEGGERVFVSPLARRMAQQAGLDVGDETGEVRPEP